ncbi:MAG: HAMP domain-containing sensor histidine kinase, partial [Gammaproteobacteria bacterium]
IGKLARQLQKSGKKIQELLKNQKDFLRDVSHEVRSPLARLQLAAETLELDIKDKKKINQIKEEVMIIDQLVQDLLYLSHFDRPSFSHEISDISISDLINKCIKRSNIIACQKNLSIHLEGLDQHDINIRAIELLIDRALDNVINNAIRYSPEGSKITINYKDDSEFCYLEICDQGEGVHDDNLEKIFEPFFRTDSSRNRQTGGFGLGLALVKRIMELHQGSVTAVNQLEGFMVRMTIPVEMKL